MPFSFPVVLHEFLAQAQTRFDSIVFATKTGLHAFSAIPCPRFGSVALAILIQQDGVAAAVASLGGRALYAEKWVSFVRELAVMVARNVRGEVSVYPVVETVQTDNICHCVLVPANCSQTVQERAAEVWQTL